MIKPCLLDWHSKTSAFIGSANKLKVNFGHLQANVVSTLLKSYCCSYYSYQMWELDSLGFRIIFMPTSWNRGVHTIFNMPYTTHTYNIRSIVETIAHELTGVVLAFCMV